MRRRLALSTLVIVAGVCGGQALAAGSVSVSLHSTALHIAGYRAMDYTKPFALKGTLSNHAGGVTVTLSEDVFPFHGGFQTVASQKTGSHGAFKFRTTLTAATRFRVSAASAHSPVITVYALEHGISFTCDICGSRQGLTTVHVSSTYEVPPALAAEHAARPVYAYLSVIAGRKAPTVLARRKVVKQHASASIPGEVSLSYSIHFSALPGKAGWTWQVDNCFRGHESKDGFGIPGHHQCGNKKVVLGKNTYLG